MIKRRATAAGLDGSFAGTRSDPDSPPRATPRHHAPRPLEVRECNAWLCAGRKRLERQRRCTARAIGLSTRVFLHLVQLR
jgi:hypothetical protein